MQIKSRRNKSPRQLRKLEHLRLAMSLPPGPGRTGFDDVLLLPEALPNIATAELDLSTTFLGYRLQSPILINAMTGGTPEAARINARLAKVAKEAGLALALGSQRAALEDPSLVYTYTIARRVNPGGVILANLGAGCTPQDAQRAVEMLGAQGLQLHLNAAQELTMVEGDRVFRWQDSIAAITKEMSVPVIAKEVGCGITGSTAKRLINLGIRALDVGGKGGTNFVAIETARRARPNQIFINWGLPTVWSLLDVVAVLREASLDRAEVCASGGIANGLDMAKALALGAQVCGVAGPLLRAVVSGGVKAGLELVNQWQGELRSVLALTGARNLTELRQKPIVITGVTYTWAVQRNLLPRKEIE
ncbi:MAG: type 2 isopentenyl-diphosphate Delta-isomerase [bacterium]